MLYDKILSDLVDDSGKITDSGRNKIVTDVKNILINGTNSLSPVLKSLLSEADQFDGIPIYNDIDLEDKEKFPQFHNDTIDVLFASVLSILNVNGKTPIPLVFDPSGLIPELPELPTGPGQVPPKFFRLLNILQIPNDQILAILNQFLISNSINLQFSSIDNILDLSDEDLFLAIGFQETDEINVETKINSEEDGLKSKYSDLIKNNILSKAGEEVKIQIEDALKQIFKLPPPIPAPPIPPIPPTNPSAFLGDKLQPLLNDIIEKNSQFF